MSAETVLPPPVPDSPSLAVQWEKLDPRYVVLLRTTNGLWSGFLALFWLAIVIAVVMLTPLPESFRLPLFGVWGIATLLHLSWNMYKPGLWYRNASFRVDADGIEIRRGFLVRSIISVPRSRVQHTDVSQGPFERRHGLGTLEIYTAGVSHASVPLAGLAHERAIEIRDALLPRDRVQRA